LIRSKQTAGLRCGNPLWLILFALTAAGCQSAGMPVGDGDTVVVHKSTNDDREYRYLVLPNRMKVLLASDPDADKAAASLVVFRGSYHEDPAYPGLAHFLEHMLFIGTQKYPEVDGYQQFIGGHGGTSNAYTAPDHTNYFFDIQPAYLDEALDRFAQFFISPLLAADYVDHPRNSRCCSAGWRLRDRRLWAGDRGAAATPERARALVR
jgi:hypothetical protein